jgi:hypothetical protein
MQLWIITKLLQDKNENDDVELRFKGGFFTKKKNSAESFITKLCL